MSKKVRLEKQENKKPFVVNLVLIQTIGIVILMILVFIILVVLVGTAENATNYYNHPLV